MPKTESFRTVVEEIFYVPISFFPFVCASGDQHILNLSISLSCEACFTCNILTHCNVSTVAGMGFAEVTPLV